MSVPAYFSDALADCDTPIPEGERPVVVMRSRRDALQAARNLLLADVQRRGLKALPADEQRAFDDAREVGGRLTDRINELDAAQVHGDAAAKLHRDVIGPAYDQAYRVGREARTYNPDTAHRGVSFFRDVVAAETMADYEARDRLALHSREVAVEREMRATTTGSFAGLVVPQYLVEQAALVARAGRPVANSVTRLKLPESGVTFQVPRGTTGASVAAQSPENTNVSSTDEVWANLTLTLTTIAGQQDVSRQSLERGTLVDQLVYGDLAAAYAAELDKELINGSGSSGQLLGILQTSGINAATAFGAAVTAANVQTKIAGQVSAVLGSRFMAPTVIYMHPRRWAWFMSLSDSSGRPLVTPNVQGPTNAVAVLKDAFEYGQVVGSLQGLPVIADANIPTTVGAATGGEDIIIVARAEDILLFEDDPMPRQLRFEQTLGNQLTVKLVCYGYVAATAGRYPVAVGKIGGLDTTTNGLVAPTF